VRRHRIGSSERIGQEEPSLFVQEGDDSELARKILPAGVPDGDRPNHDDVVFWTGEKLGVVSFSAKPAFTAEDFEVEEGKTAEHLEREARAKEQSDMVRRALEMHADDVRLTRRLGLG
jgi:hypothetical protein